MAIKVRQALIAVGELLREPFASSPSLRLVDAMARSRMMRALNERLVADLSDEARAKLHRLTQEGIDRDALLRLPESTFGHQYGVFLRERGLSTTAVQDIWPPISLLYEEQWIPWRSAKLHDMHHFLLGFPLTPRGEMALQLFNL